MKRLGLVKASTLEPFIRFLVNNEIDLAPHFRVAHISPELVTNEDTWLPKQQVYRFLSDVAATHEMEALGLVVGDQICVADLGALGEEIYRCQTLEDACRHFAELVPQFAEGNTASVTVGKEKTWFTYRTTDHRTGNRDYADHYGMMLLLSVVRLVAGHWYPEEVTIQTGACDAFMQHPAWKDTYITFNADASGFAFPSAWNVRSIPNPPKAMAAESAEASYTSNPPETLTNSLEVILHAYLNIGGVPSLSQVAESLNLSERTLKRRLANEGDSYSDLTDRVRIRAAKTLLQNPDMSVKKVSYILGYSGANNFIRAFKRVTGKPPGAYRRA